MKHYRITLHKGACSLANELALLAAKSNGGDDITLNELKGIFDAQKRLYEYSNKNKECEIIGDTLLHLDAPVSGQELNQTVLIIEQVEIEELEELKEFNGYGALSD